MIKKKIYIQTYGLVVLLFTTIILYSCASNETPDEASSVTKRMTMSIQIADNGTRAGGTWNDNDKPEDGTDTERYIDTETL